MPNEPQVHVLIPTLMGWAIACGATTLEAVVPVSLRHRATCPPCLAKTSAPLPHPGLPVVREADLQEVLRQAASLHQWVYYHGHDSRHSPAGFPDTVLCRGERLLFVELKMPGKTPTPAQKTWLKALAAVRQVEARLVYPDGLDSLLEALQ